jgi:hypothetical protein
MFQVFDQATHVAVGHDHLPVGVVIDCGRGDHHRQCHEAFGRTHCVECISRSRREGGRGHVLDDRPVRHLDLRFQEGAPDEGAVCGRG